MDWLNYHHLYYFWTVAREGSIAKASAALRLAQPTISAQIRALEESLGQPLFSRVGRGLALTDVGHTVLRYADEIFTLGRELTNVVKGRPAGRAMRLVVGVADVLPKLIAYRLLEPALRLDTPVILECREDTPDRLLQELSVHGVDLVLSDEPLGSHVRVRAYSHLLGECGVTFFGAPGLAAQLRRRFPASLDGAPMLLPGAGASLRRPLQQWLEAQQIQPQVVGEFEDSALMKVFGQAGAGAFVAPTAIEREVRRQYGVQIIGRTDDLRERFYAISVERRIKHPAVAAICEIARQGLFAPMAPKK
jgi:LysR family transcriptional activator of nhaA